MPARLLPNITCIHNHFVTESLRSSTVMAAIGEEPEPDATRNIATRRSSTSIALSLISGSYEEFNSEDESDPVRHDPVNRLQRYKALVGGIMRALIDLGPEGLEVLRHDELRYRGFKDPSRRDGKPIPVDVAYWKAKSDSLGEQCRRIRESREPPKRFVDKSLEESIMNWIPCPPPDDLNLVLSPSPPPTVLTDEELDGPRLESPHQLRGEKLGDLYTLLPDSPGSLQRNMGLGHVKVSNRHTSQLPEGRRQRSKLPAHDVKAMARTRLRPRTRGMARRTQSAKQENPRVTRTRSGRISKPPERWSPG